MRLILIKAVVILCGAAAIALAAPARAAETSASVSEATDRGVALARQGQWALAIRYFQRAHEEAPDNPAVLLNLALANDRMGSHELAAAAWYRAFLSAAPFAGNAAQVRERVRGLETEIEVRIQKIIDVVRGIVPELRDPAERVGLISWLMRAQVEFGDITAAKAEESRLPAGTNAGWGVAHMASFHARNDSVALAMAEADRIRQGAMRSWAFAEIAVEQAKRRDYDGALRTIEKIRVGRELAYALSRIAVLRARAGDALGARKTLDQIKPTETAARAIGGSGLAVALAQSGDRDGATRVLEQVEADIAELRQHSDRMTVQAFVAVARAAIDPNLMSLSAVSSIPDGAYRDRALRDIAAIRGEIATAEIFHWASVAHEIEANSRLGDIAASVDGAKTKVPVQSGIAIATVAYEAARALEKLRE